MKRALGLVAVAGLMWLATPAPQAEATALINPGIAASDAAQLQSGVIDVRWRHHRHHLRRWHWHRHYRH
jgi:hypothetical protein